MAGADAVHFPSYLTEGTPPRYEWSRDEYDARLLVRLV